MSQLKAVIVDDEPDSISMLRLQLSRHCPEVKTIGAFTSSAKALEQLPLLRPDVLFLDIEMPVMNGFELLERLMPLQFGVVFITAYNEHAVLAFRFNALDYLVKPVDPEELKAAVAKACQNLKPTTAQLDFLQRQMQGERFRKIAIPAQTGVSFIDLDDIIYVEASNNYSRLVLKDGPPITISKTLKDIQDILEESHFMRIHRQYISNLHHVRHFSRKDHLLTMDNGKELPVARNQGERLMGGFDQL